MHDSPSDPSPGRDGGTDEPEPRAAPGAKSFGNMSDAHWSRSRAGTNEEALEYYRERSRAPGVASGGAERNFYCMRCDGVIAHDHRGASCPHCGEPLEGTARRYFNWVEINEPASSDFKALLPFVLGGVVVLVLILCIALWMFA